MPAMQHLLTILISQVAFCRGMIGFASVACFPATQRTLITCKNTFQNAHDAEISSFFAQPDLASGCAFCAPGDSKNPRGRDGPAAGNCFRQCDDR